MTRRNGMWITIICILVVGVSVTRMTRRLVSSAGADTAAITSVSENFAAAQQAAPMEAPQAAASMKKQLTGQATTKEEPRQQKLSEAESSADLREALTEQAPFAAGGTAYASEDLTEEGISAAESYALSGRALTEVYEETAADSASEVSDLDGGTTGGTQKTEVSIAEAADEVPETVKSPLEPAAETNSPGASFRIAEERAVSYTADDLCERLSQTEEKAKQCRDGMVESNSVSVYAAAEQERILWDRELNIIYNAIRGSMTEAEAEELKYSELEWLKERDLAADKATAKSTLPQNQNPDAVRVLAEKTRERCYELVSDYEEVLERADEFSRQ